MTKETSRVSQASHEWDHISETITMLTLAVAQIEASILESEKSFDKLAGNFTSIVNTTQTTPSLAPDNSELRRQLESLQNDVQQAVMDFQFFDRLAQRLHHVKESLDELGALFLQTDKLKEPGAWTGLQNNLKDRYTMQCEREMFDLILSGATVESALQHFRDHYLEEKARQEESDGEIDLF